MYWLERDADTVCHTADSKPTILCSITFGVHWIIFNIILTTDNFFTLKNVKYRIYMMKYHGGVTDNPRGISDLITEYTWKNVLILK